MSEIDRERTILRFLHRGLDELRREAGRGVCPKRRRRLGETGPLMTDLRQRVEEGEVEINRIFSCMVVEYLNEEFGWKLMDL